MTYIVTPPPPPPPPEEVVVTRQRVVTERYGGWSPAQFIAAGIGIFLGVLGGLVLARTGFNDLTGETTAIWGFDHTGLMGVIDVALGVLFLLSAMSAVGSRSTLRLLGLLMLGFGIFVVIDPGALDGTLGTNASIGWLYVGLGAGAGFTGLVVPIVYHHAVAA